MAIRHVKPFRANNAAPLTSNFQKSLPRRTSSVMAILSKRAIRLTTAMSVKFTSYVELLLIYMNNPMQFPSVERRNELRRRGNWKSQ